MVLCYLIFIYFEIEEQFCCTHIHCTFNWKTVFGIINGLTFFFFLSLFLLEE